jgi:acetyl esterase/lipase
VAGSRAAVAAAAAARRAPPSAVRETRDVAYGAHARHRLDFYAPAPAAAEARPTTPSSSASSLLAGATVPQNSSPPLLPVIVFAHGGGWKKGSARSSVLRVHANVGRALARRGFLVAVINYRKSSILLRVMLPLYALQSALAGLALLAIAGRALAPAPVPPGAAAACFLVPLLLSLASQLVWWGSSGRGVRHPAHADDLVQATAFVHAHAARFGGDASRLAIVGHSAGAHMAMMAVLRAADGADGAPLPRGAVRAVAALSGVYDGALLAGDAGGANALSRCVRRSLYLEPVFGLDRAAWVGSFPVGVLTERERARGAAAMAVAVAVDDAAAAAKEQRERGGAAAAAKELERNGSASPAPSPLPVLLLNVRSDWGLDKHTDVLFPLLLARPDLFDAERVSVEGGEHASYIIGFDARGSLGDAVVAQGVAEWLLRRL